MSPVSPCRSSGLRSLPLCLQGPFHIAPLRTLAFLITPHPCSLGHPSKATNDLIAVCASQCRLSSRSPVYPSRALSSPLDHQVRMFLGIPFFITKAPGRIKFADRCQGLRLGYGNERLAP